MSSLYKVHEFAELSGVTVKALHHYDRLGLLKPRRTDAGYWIYSESDIERLEQIVALKFLGLSLRRIRAVLDRPAVELPDALRLQRQVLEQKQQLFARAISAIVEAEKAIRPGKPTDPAVLKTLIEVIDMQEEFGAMKQYWDDGAWSKYEEALTKIKIRSGSAEEWKDLMRDIVAALGDDPAGKKAQALGARYMKIMKRDARLFSFVNDAGFLAGGTRALADRQNWPVGVASRIEKANFHQAVPFILKIMAARPKES